MKALRIACLLLVLAAVVRPGGAEEPGPLRPFESPPGSVAPTQLDLLVATGQARLGVRPARPCSDEVFLRRVHLDVLGALPTPAEAKAFLADRRPDRRTRLVDALLARDEAADWQALLWCDALRVKSEFPIDLWPNAAQAYHRWVRDALRENRPYDRFARELLTSSGSNFREPAVNFWRAAQGRTPAALAGAVALTFMGTRVDAWPAPQRAAMAPFFSRVTYKRTAEWKEEIVLSDPAPQAALDATLPDGTAVRIGADDDPRRVFADWLVDARNPWFARAAVNRVWAWLLGRGLVHEPDDLRPDNPPVLPEALSYLERQLADGGWDLRRTWRTILVSRTYQQSPVPRGDPAIAEACFACYPVRRLDAEVLIDALCSLGGAGETYTSSIPEPWTFVPPGRTVALADGSVTSAFLERFGRPARDTGLWSERGRGTTVSQALHLLNSTDVRRRIERSPRLRAALASSRGDVSAAVRGIYLTILSREPVERELAAAQAYFAADGRPRQEAAEDLAWALVNTREFLFRH